MAAQSEALTHAHKAFVPGILYQIKLVAKIAISVGFVASLILAVIVFSMTDQSDGSAYWVAIKSIYATKKLIGPTLLISALILISAVGIITWIISVYSTARITGALYRFTRNIELTINKQSLPFVSIREDDYLKQDAKLLEQTNTTINQHYQTINQQVQEIERDLDSCTPLDLAQLKLKIDQLKDQEKKVSLGNA